MNKLTIILMNLHRKFLRTHLKDYIFCIAIKMIYMIPIQYECLTVMIFVTKAAMMIFVVAEHYINLLH